MINFNGKELIPDCMERVLNSGYIVFYEDNVLNCSNPVEVQKIVDNYTLDDAKRWKSNLIAIFAKELRDKAISLYSPGEMAAWPIKIAEAAKYSVTRNQDDAPMLKTEAFYRNMSLDELITKVNSKAGTFALLEASISGTDGFHRDNVKALNSFDEIASYDYSTRWPEV